jgi:polyvinyl alcohol dehydrogenase (cytochrome)
MKSFDRAPSRARLSAALGCVALMLAMQGCSSQPSSSGVQPPGGTAPPNTTPSTTGPVMAGGAGGAPSTPSLTGGSAPVATGGSAAPPVATAGSMAPPATAGSMAPPSTEGPDQPTNPGTPGASADWKMMGYDLGSTYYNSAETKLTKDNAASLTEAYTLDMGGPTYGAPLQIGDKIYASGPSYVIAVDAATGQEQWRTSVGSTGSLAFDDGTLYIDNNTANIVAINAADGKMLWSKKTHATETADGSSSPLVAGDVVLIGGSSGSIELIGGAFRGFMSALDKKTGDIKWSTYTVPENAKGASIWSSPSADVAAGIAYGATGNNYGAPATDSSDSIIAFDLATGAIKWKAQRVMNDTFGGGLGGVGPDSDFGANPVLYETMVDGKMTKVASAGTKGGTAHAIKRDDGSLLWTRTLGTGQADGSFGVFVNSTWTGKYMLMACNEGGPATLYALDGATGDIKWMRKLTGQVWGRMSSANGLGFVGTGTNLEVFDVETGSVLKTVASKGGTVAGTITISNGRVAFGEGLTWSTGRAGSKLTVLMVK